MGSDDFYTKVTGTTNLFGNAASFGTEPNMRQEAINTLEGSFPEIAKGQPGLVRRMRRDANSELIECACVDSFTKEPDKDRFCPICMGEAYLWDEADIVFYRVPEDSDVDNILKDKLIETGLINHPLVVFYTRYDSDIEKHDKIVELVLEADGTAAVPRKRKNIFKIGLLWDYRSDNGKLEYYKLFCHLESVEYLNAPKFGDL